MDPGLRLPGPRSRPGFQEGASTRCSSAPSDVLGSPGSSLVLLAPSIHQGQHGACSSARSRCGPWHALIECICRMQQHSPSCSVQPSGQPDPASSQHSSGVRWRMQQRMQQVRSSLPITGPIQATCIAECALSCTFCASGLLSASHKCCHAVMAES